MEPDCWQTSASDFVVKTLLSQVVFLAALAEKKKKKNSSRLSTFSVISTGNMLVERFLAHDHKSCPVTLFTQESFNQLLLLVFIISNLE